MALEVVGYRFAEDVVQDPMSEEGVGQDISSSNIGGDLVGEARGEFPVDSCSHVHLFLCKIGPVSSAQMTQEKKTSVVTCRDEWCVVRFRPDRHRLRDESALV
jgi:hypothetical protein